MSKRFKKFVVDKLIMRNHILKKMYCNKIKRTLNRMYAGKSRKEAFELIYKNNIWGGVKQGISIREKVHEPENIHSHIVK